MPTLRDLSHLLRHKEEWPEGFIWDYTNRETCAVELANLKFGLNLPDGEKLEEIFDISSEERDNIFIHAAYFYLEDTRKITPEQVADVIDAL